MRLLRGTREAGLAVVAALLILVIAILDLSSTLRGAETASFDLRFRLRGAEPPGTPIAIVMVDDASLAALGRWPLSRHLFADAIRQLHRDGAKLIVFDLLFAEPDRPVPAELQAEARRAAARADDNGLRQSLDRLAGDDPDGDLAAAIHEAGNVLLPVAFSFTGPAGNEPDVLAASAFQSFDRSSIAPAFPLEPKSALLPVPPLAAAAAALGHVDLAYDRDGEPRYDYLALPFAGDFFPSLPLRAAASFLGVPWNDVALAPGSGVRLGTLDVPSDPGMRLLINYRGPRGTYPTYSFADVMAGRVPAGAFAGKIVLIGASFLGNADSNGAPFGSTQLPGTERMANIIDTVLTKDFITEITPPQLGPVVIAVVLLASLSGLAMAHMPTRTAFLAGLGPIAIWAFAVQWAFLHDVWLPFVGPGAALVAAAISVIMFRYWIVDREGRYVRSAFRHYLSPDMVNLLAEQPHRLKLGGETRAMTMLFCDVRGFTAISESFKSNPQGLTQLINRFLTPLTDIIMSRAGTIDKYMGDCIMAFWNAPLDDPRHADHACESALAMMRALDGVNAMLEAEASASGRPSHHLKIGIGINTGECVVGNMGSDQRFDYSVLGDAVNLASRLEGQSKTYGVGIVIGETTREAAPDWAALELDLIAVKGKREAVRIFALLGNAAVAADPAFRALAARFAAMLHCYRTQDWAGARAALNQCRALDPSLAELYALYDERIAQYESDPPGPYWDGVYVAESK
ncbi:MAG TPA: adenylate/guanylate cyclase domain-containing protein [Stellaceae bacterium]|nr:adenylate/guanylate cyclase domain-containing protein [Stellaceae bacterium]